MLPLSKHVLTDEEKKNVRRHNNRLAAAKCRKKKTDTIQYLSERNEKLKSSLNQMSSIFMKMLTQRNLLIEELHSCKSSFNYMPNADIEDIVRDYDNGFENLNAVKQMIDYANSTSGAPMDSLEVSPGGMSKSQAGQSEGHLVNDRLQAITPGLGGEQSFGQDGSGLSYQDLSAMGHSAVTKGY